MSYLLFNLAGVDVTTFFIGGNSDIGLLQCWRRVTRYSGEAPPRHCRCLAGVQGLDGARQAYGGNRGGEGEGGAEEQHCSIVFALIVAVLRMYSDGGDIASVHIGVSCVVGADKDLDRTRVLHIPCIDIDNTMCRGQHMAPC